jgi:EmrB/QacA subfamily drug resistance transporter
MARKWWTLLAVCTGVFMLLLDITIVNVALPYIQQAFHASLADLQWVIDAYALTLAAFLLTSGSVADLAGRRLVFAVGIVVFTVGSTLCGVASDPTFLALSRAFQGVGGAIMFATSLALLADAFPPRERGVAFGVFGAVTGIAVAVGPVLGGALTSWLSWRWIFFVNVPIGVFALAVTLREVAESKAPVAKRPDWLGFATFTLGLTGLVYGLIRSHPDGWGSTTVIGSLGAAVVLLALFVIVELRTRSPMLDLELLKVPTFNGGLVAAFAISASIFALLTYLVLYLQNVLGSSAIDTGVRLLPFTGAIFLMAGLAGRLTGHVPTKLLIGPGFVLIGIGLVLMRGITPADDWTHLLPGMIVAGIGSGLVNVPLASTAVGVVEPARSGMASGINSTFRQIGIATGVAALGSILASQVSSSVVTKLAHSPLASGSHALASSISNGSILQAMHGVPPHFRELAGAAAKSSFVDGLNTIILIGAIVAFAAAVLTLLLIRQRDFVDVHHAQPAEGPRATAEADAPQATVAAG